MRLLIIVLVILASLSGIALAIQECDSPIEPADIPCNMISTYDFEGDCNTHTLKIYNDVPELLETRNWSNYTIPGICNSTFNYTEGGSYYINSSEGSSITIIVNQKNSEFYLYLGALVVFILFIVLGYMTEQNIFPILAGMLSVAIGIHIAVTGFPNLTNEFLKDAIIVILLGIGFWLMIAPSIKVWEEWR